MERGREAERSALSTSWHALEQLVQHSTHAPPVDRLGVWLTLDHLGRNVPHLPGRGQRKAAIARAVMGAAVGKGACGLARRGLTVPQKLRPSVPGSEQ
jgi:hypothetical protein